MKKHNPDLKVFGLYGGETSKAEEYKNKLCKHLDDFYVFSANTDKDWKWINGDLIILDWYDERGRNLDWDSVIVIQWDMLVFDSLEKIFLGIKKDEMFVSGIRSVDKELEDKWDWVKLGSEERQNYLNFLKYIEKTYQYKDEPLASLFIIQVFPRIFFDKYLTVKNKEVGMLEYKIPTYAKIFGIPFYKKDIGVKWYGGEPKPLNAIPQEISEEYIKEQLTKQDGWRIFHPYFKMWEL